MSLKNLAAFLLSMLISLPPHALAAESIGIAAITSGTSIEGKGEFKINDKVVVGDIIKTGEKGSVTILFNDESMLTLGPNSSARIDVFKEGRPGESRLTIISGQFRYFPGTILEHGGKQTVINQGATAASAGAEVAISETGLNTAVEGGNNVLDVSISELNATELTVRELDIILTETVPASGLEDTGAATGIAQDPPQ